MAKNVGSALVSPVAASMGVNLNPMDLLGISSAEDDARKLMEQGLAQYAGISVPEARELILKHPEVVGEYLPEMEQMVELGPSAMEDVSTDPRLQAAQMKALEQISGIADAGGLTPADLAALDDVRRRAAGEAQAKSEQVMQEMQSRGLGGAGAELAAKLSAGQKSADLASQQGMDVAQQAQRRALEAMMQQGSMAGQMRSQSFGEQSDIARSKDVISQFNVAQQQQRQARNIAAQREAQMRNLQERQRIAEDQTRLTNLQRQQAIDAEQQQFANQMSLAGARAGQYGAQAGAAQERAGTRAGILGSVISGGAQVGAGMAGKK